MADVSRIFVRGLPPNMKEDDFRQHFSKQAPITDAKLIAHRRIGYVGYKTPEAAAKAVKYYNKSFIWMSRIGVEFARPVSELKPEHGQRTAFEHDERPAKRPMVARPEEKDDLKLKEFLNVMQPPSKSKIWSNEDFSGTGANSVAVQAPCASEDVQNSDEEYEHVPKRRKKSPKTSEESETSISKPDISAPQGIDKLDEDGDKTLAEETPNQVSTEPTSDADWLRSRTNRVLDILDDEELVGGSHSQQAPISNKQATARDEVEAAGNATLDAGSQTANQATPPAQPANVEKNDVPQIPAEIGRLFVRNLSYETTEDELRGHFSSHGTIEEIHIPQDTRSRKSKGFAYIQFNDTDAASQALAELDGKSFQGRVLHILPAAMKKDNALDEYAISKLPHKKQQQIRRKAEASSATFKWNTLYMNPDAVMSSIADRLKIAKSELIDPTSSGAAVKQAHAETNIIQETKAYLSSQGVNIEAFHKKGFSDTVILVKNFSYGTTPEEIRTLFEAHGSLTKLLMPPSGTIAIVELEQPGQARAAFGALAYRKFKDSVLFLEKAPKHIFDGTLSVPKRATEIVKDGKLSASDLLENTEEPEVATSSTLFVRNLNFTTTSARLHELFQPLNGFMSVRVKTRSDPKRGILSMGYGFIEFSSKEDAQSARQAMDGYKLDGHDLLIKESHKALDAAEERRKEDTAKKLAGRRTKVIIKNLPFEATKKDVQQLVGPYGKLRSVRVPRKFDNSTRGFAFAEFVTAREAENAMEALAGSHLLGRRLNMEFAAEESIDPEEEIEKMSKKVGRQADKVALQKLTSGGRKKFSLDKEGDDVDMD